MKRVAYNYQHAKFRVHADDAGRFEVHVTEVIDDDMRSSSEWNVDIYSVSDGHHDWIGELSYLPAIEQTSQRLSHSCPGWLQQEINRTLLHVEWEVLTGWRNVEEQGERCPTCGRCGP
jgi:hypothetical protein